MAKRSKSKSKKIKTSDGQNQKAPASWASMPWEKVQVTKDGDEMRQSKKQSGVHDDDDVGNASDTSFDESKYHNEKNHYDDPKADPRELYGNSNGNGRSFRNKAVDGADDPGIFFGLEVIDGSQYQVEKVPVYSSSKKGGDGLGEDNAEPEGYITKLVVKDGNYSDEWKKTLPSTSKSNTNNVSPEEPTKDVASTTVVDATDMTKLSRKEKNKLKLAKLKAKRKEIKLKKKRKREEKETSQQEGQVSESTSLGDDDKPSDALTTKAPKKKHRNKDSDKSNVSLSATATKEIVTQQCMNSIQNSWCLATGGVYLHEKLCASLYRLDFHSPTPIQGSTLAASILGQRDIVGAAPTGSGKTLSYLLPIMHRLLKEEDEREENDESNEYSHPLTALILCPTRELAMQVSMEFAKLTSDVGSQSNINCGTIVGGLSEQKQRRVLDVNKPPVLVATPGRLWDLMSSGEHEHLNNLRTLRYLVVDEADRMATQGSFPQLESILDKIQEANPSLEYMRDHEESDDESDDEDEYRMLGLPGIRGEARVEMLNDDLLKMIARNEKSNTIDDNHSSDEEEEVPQPIELDDEEYENQRNEMEEFEDTEENGESEEEELVKRQTFVFSATLTLPASTHRNIGAGQKEEKKRGRHKQPNAVDGVIAEILERVGAQGQAKVVDLSTSKTKTVHKSDTKNKKRAMKDESDEESKVKLPPGLSLYEIRCTQRHKDSHLYAFLSTTKQGASGPSLVFCNSIGAVKRVGETLKLLGLPTRMLHAQMQQKARLSALESLKGTNSRSIVVCTDVAARGLDLPRVASVVHYDIARAIDTYVHRAGRTARGMGENAKGWSVSLVSSSEEKNHELICQAVKGSGKKCFDVAPMDSRLLANAQERVNLASKIVSCENVESKTNKSNKWFIDAAEEAGLDLDEDLLDEGLRGGSLRERQQFNEAKRSRQALKVLLAKPMRTQTFGKFLSNAGLAQAIRAENDVKPFIVPQSGTKRKKKRKAS